MIDATAIGDAASNVIWSYWLGKAVYNLIGVMAFVVPVLVGFGFVLLFARRQAREEQP